MNVAQMDLILHDLEPQNESLKGEILEGLGGAQKTLPCKYLYDERGSQLFDKICQLKEYYPTRTEEAILRDYSDEMAEMAGANASVIELGSGSSLKTPILLRALEAPTVYAPIDISKDHLLAAAERIHSDFPELRVIPICADYLAPIHLPSEFNTMPSRLVFFPGSTIGNFEPPEAIAFLRRMSDLMGESGSFLVGVDLKKRIDVLRDAYNDSEGVTAAFNLNLLARINREMGGEFDLDRFAHRAVFNDKKSRIELYLVSQDEQTVRVDGRRFFFAKGETIHTESSYKYTLDGFSQLASQAGLRVRRVWTDERDWFSVQLLEAA